MPTRKNSKTSKGSKNKKNTRKTQYNTRARGKQEVLSGQLKTEVTGIVLIALALLFVVALIASEPGVSTGFMNLISKGFLSKLFGKAAFTIPLIFAYTGIMMLMRKSHYLVFIRFFGMFMLALTASVIADYIVWSDTALAYQFREYILLTGDAGGGLIGSSAAFAFISLFGLLGAKIVNAALLAIGFVITTNIPLAVAVRGIITAIKSVFIGIYNFFAKLFGKRDKVKPERQARTINQGDLAYKNLVATKKDPTDIPSLYRQFLDGDQDTTDKKEIDTEKEPAQMAPTSGKTYGFETRVGKKKASDIPTDIDGHYAKGDSSNASTGSTPQQMTLLDTKEKVLPPLSLLKPLQKSAVKDTLNTAELSRMLEETLASFGVSAKVADVCRGPMVTRFEIHPGFGVKVSKIVNLADDLALAFAAPGVRIEAPIPGKAAVGIEVPNKLKQTVFFREVLESNEFKNSQSKLTIALGKDIAGKPILADLAEILHLLVAGSTGSGKSVCLNSIISSILFKANPDEVKLLMIDPKRVELSIYDGIPHLVAPVVTDSKKAAGYLRWVVEEMENRYKQFQVAGVRNIAQYNEAVEKGTLNQYISEEDNEIIGNNIKPLPYIVVILDELADLMMVASNEVEDAICRLAFMARAAGIHLILATQRPSVDVVTGIIKANIPSRIAFAVSSQVDSRIILDSSGAERLLGKGDMLFHPIGLPKPIRVQGAYISDEEVGKLVDFVKNQGAPVYQAKSLDTQNTSKSEGIAEDDEHFADACRLVVESGQASISNVQRRFRVGYARAARLIDTMEVLHIVGPFEGSKPRKVLVSINQLEEMFSSGNSDDKTYVEEELRD